MDQEEVIKKLRSKNCKLLIEAAIATLANKYVMRIDQAKSLFENSLVVKDIKEHPEEYDDKMPEDVIDLWKNERILGVLISTKDLKNDAVRVGNSMKLNSKKVYRDRKWMSL